MGRRKTTQPMPWLRQRLRAVHANATDLARHLDIPPARVYEMIKGQRQFQPHEIAKAASFLKIGESQLLKLIEGAIDVREIGINDVNSVPWSNVGDLSVPLLRATLASHGRWVLHIGREEGRVVRPEVARFSSTAFAIVVQDECNRPVYRARDRILIDPESPVSAGDDVVLSSESRIDAQDALHVIPGQLMNMTEATWTLKQYANDIERSYSKKQFPRAWKIISRFMRV